MSESVNGHNPIDEHFREQFSDLDLGGYQESLWLGLESQLNTAAAATSGGAAGTAAAKAGSTLFGIGKSTLIGLAVAGSVAVGGTATFLLSDSELADQTISPAPIVEQLPVAELKTESKATPLFFYKRDFYQGEQATATEITPLLPNRFHTDWQLSPLLASKPVVANRLSAMLHLDPISLPALDRTPTDEGSAKGPNKAAKSDIASFSPTVPTLPTTVGIPRTLVGASTRVAPQEQAAYTQVQSRSKSTSGTKRIKGNTTPLVNASSPPVPSSLTANGSITPTLGEIFEAAPPTWMPTLPPNQGLLAASAGLLRTEGQLGNREVNLKTSRFISRFYLMGGVRGGNGLRNNTIGRDRFTISPMVGLGYEQAFKGRWSVMAEAHYFQRKGFSLLDSLVQESYYLTSRIETQYSELQTIDFLHLPLHLSYQAQRHAFTTGPFASIVIGGTSSLATFTNTGGAMLGQDNGMQEGYLNGIRTATYGWHWGYEYGIWESLRVGARFNYSLRPLTTTAIQKPYRTSFFDTQFYLRVTPF